MNDLYHFGQFVLDPRRRTLSRSDRPVFLTPKAFDVLFFLVQNPNRLVTKEELLKAVWGDTFVEEGNLTQYISHLRKALGANPEDPRLIVTIARKGYQFSGTVSVEPADMARPASSHVPAMRALPVGAGTQQETPAGDTVSKAASRSWKAALALSAAVILGMAGYVSWRQILVPPSRLQKVRLAVLPFQNLTGDPDKEYLADGLTEEMISRLGRVSEQELGVIARTSVMAYKHGNERLDQIGRDLSVQYVLESSLRESGNHLRLTAQLIQVQDQTHLWSKDYDYTTNDILTVEHDVAEAIAQEIRLRLPLPQQPTAGHPHSVNPEAFDAYLHGYYFFQRNTSKDTEMSAKFYERATQLDPAYAPAWVGLSRVRNWQVNIGALPAEEGRRLAGEAVERAVALDPNLAEAYAQMARLKAMLDFDWVGVAAASQRAIALEPGNPDILRAVGGWASLLGRFDEALQFEHRAADLDPLNPETWEALAETEYHRGELGRAAADGQKALALSPDVWPGSILLSEIFVMQGRYREALQEIERVRYEPFRAPLYPIVYHALGRTSESDAALSEFISKYPGNEYQIASVYAFRQQPDEAFAWLDKAYAHHNSGLVATRVDPFLKNLQHDPRYAALLRKLNFPT